MHSGRTVRAFRAFLPALVLATLCDVVPADVATSEALKGLTVSEDRRARETLYQPAYDKGSSGWTWKSTELFMP